MLTATSCPKAAVYSLTAADTTNVCALNIFSVGSIFLLNSYAICELETNRTTQPFNKTCRQGYFGAGCARSCPAACPLTCDNEGLCSVCSRPGVQLPDCTRNCTKGLYGLHCKNRCLACRLQDCEPEVGNCRQCRLPGFRLPFCRMPCLPGTFGMNCKNRCPLPCGEACDPATGDCTQCRYGHGPRCQINCAKESNREACRLYCPDKCFTWCSTVDNTCAVCAPGYKPPYCIELCDRGYHGSNCRETCSLRCSGGRCQPVTGFCYACIDGYVGERCNGQCVPGLYGPGCLLHCPDSCATLCNFTTGMCSRCSPGYTGPRCYELCQEGRYGDSCKLECPVTCGGKCDPVTGECWFCVAGYAGSFCNETCQEGTYGQGCANLCPTECFNNMCDHVTGKCRKCNQNLYGGLCAQADSMDPGPLWQELVLLLSLGASVVIVGLVILVIVCLKRRIIKNGAVGNNKHRNIKSDGRACSIEVRHSEHLDNNEDKYQDTRITLIHQKRRPYTSSGSDIQCAAHPIRPHNQYLKPHSASSSHLNTNLVLPTALCTMTSSRECNRKYTHGTDISLVNVSTILLTESATDSSTTSEVDRKRLTIRPHDERRIDKTRICSHVSEIEYLKLNNEMYTSADQSLATARARMGGFITRNNILQYIQDEQYTPAREMNVIIQDEQDTPTREVNVIVTEITESPREEATVSTAWSVNTFEHVPPLTIERSSEMVTSQSEFGSIGSRKSLLGTTSCTGQRHETSLRHQCFSGVVDHQQLNHRSKSTNVLPTAAFSVSHVCDTAENSSTKFITNSSSLQKLSSFHKPYQNVHSPPLTGKLSQGTISMADFGLVTCSDGQTSASSEHPNSGRHICKLGSETKVESVGSTRSFLVSSASGCLQMSTGMYCSSEKPAPDNFVNAIESSVSDTCKNQDNLNVLNDALTAHDNYTIVSDTLKTLDASDVINDTLRTPDNDDVTGNVLGTYDNSDVISVVVRTRDSSDVISDVVRNQDKYDIINDVVNTQDNSAIISDVVRYRDNSDIISDVVNTRDNSDVISDTLITFDSSNVTIDAFSNRDISDFTIHRLFSDSINFATSSLLGISGLTSPHSKHEDETIPVSEMNMLNEDGLSDSTRSSIINPRVKSLHVSDERNFQQCHFDLLRDSPSLRNDLPVSSTKHKPDLVDHKTWQQRHVEFEVTTTKGAHSEIRKVSSSESLNNQRLEIEGTLADIETDKTVELQGDILVHTPTAAKGVAVSKWTSRGSCIVENPSPKLIRCSTTRQVSPMYSHSNVTQASTNNRLQPLPTPPPEGIKSLRSIRKPSSPFTLEFQLQRPNTNTDS